MKKTKKDAAMQWVEGMNRFTQQMLEDFGIDKIRELTLPKADEYCYVSNFPETDINGEDYDTTGQDGGTIIGYQRDDNNEILYKVELNNGTVVLLPKKDIQMDVQDFFPSCNYLWQFSDSTDIRWIQGESDNLPNETLQAVSDLGFRVYEHEQYGIFIGIEGCGFDFVEPFWMPLYDLRGYHWHDEDRYEVVENSDAFADSEEPFVIYDKEREDYFRYGGIVLTFAIQEEAEDYCQGLNNPAAKEIRIRDIIERKIQEKRILMGDLQDSIYKMQKKTLNPKISHIAYMNTQSAINKNVKNISKIKLEIQTLNVALMIINNVIAE